MKKFLLLMLMFSYAGIINAQWTNNSFTHNGITRSYRMYVPPVYNAGTAVPLIVAMHGLGDDMNNFSNIGLSDVADTANFISVYPQAIADPSFGTAWNSGAGAFGIFPNASVNDVDFIRCLIDTIASHYTINPQKIFATGFSMGAFMTNRLACEMTGTFAAIASVAGTIGSGITCSPSRNIPVCHFHGTADATISYTNNMFGMNAQPLVNYWVNFNGANTTPVQTNLPDNAPGDGYTVEHYRYAAGSSGAVVEHFKINNAPHTWLFTPTNDIDYSTEIWKFFMDKSLQVAAGVYENSFSNSISVYPNPATDVIEIMQNGNSRFSKVRIYDLQGKLILEQLFSNESMRVSLAGLSKGLYILKCFSENETLQGCQKIAVQ